MKHLNTIINKLKIESKISVSLLLAISIFSFSHAAEKYIWPVDSPPAITSSFCEFRPGHFHSGIDLKVWGRVGLPCRAIADGYVSRVKVSTGGYGRALYLRLKDGNTAVYAHLQSFSPQVERFVRKFQHEQNEFSLDYFFDEDEKIHFSEGDVVAYSGRSGVKHPHVHFEIRDSGERPLNPSLNGFDIADNVAPTPTAFALIPLNHTSSVEGDCQPRIYERPIQQHDGIFRSRDPIGVTGDIGIVFEAYDRADGAENILAAYSIELIVNGEAAFTTAFNRFDFAESRQIELERDYRLKRRGFGTFHRLYDTPGETLEMTNGDGVISFLPGKTEKIDVVIIVTDAAGNSNTVQISLVSDRIEDDSRLIEGKPLINEKIDFQSGNSPVRMDILDNYFRFASPPGIETFKINGRWNQSCAALRVEGGVSTSWAPPSDFDGVIHLQCYDQKGNMSSSSLIELYPAYPGQRNNIRVKDGKFALDIPGESLYDTTWIRIIPEPEFEVKGMIQSVFTVEPRDQPLADKVNILIHDDVSQTESGWGLYYYDDRRGWTFLDNTLQNGYISAAALSWEMFGLVKDDDTPTVNILNLKEGAVLRTSQPEFRATVKDPTSGLSADGLKMLIDGNAVPAEYDPPIDRLVYKTWKKLDFGEHTLQIIAKDRVGNETSKLVAFKIEP